MAGIVHTPVMLEEVLTYLVPGAKGELMLDCTMGEGGHAEAFLTRYPDLRYLGLDADPRIQAKARDRLAGFGARVAFRLGYFDELLASWSDSSLGEGWDLSAMRPSLVLFDLGISMFHFVEADRGFGYSKDEVLDMRLSPDAPRSAAEILASEREEELARIIYEYGEERLSRRIAAAIVEARRGGGIKTTSQLSQLVWNVVPPAYRHGRIHPATRTFQALRIAVNDELGRAQRGIRLASRLLAPGGSIAVITFHSLEDRVAKLAFRELAGKTPGTEQTATGQGDPPILEILTKKPIEPSEEELARNPASRSAKLRVARRIAA